jgi:archaellum component FlaG (FlaF/FlaG flagellin family)
VRLTDPSLEPGTGRALYDFLRRVVRSVNASHEMVQRGAGTPESVITASRGAIYLRTDGGANTTLYVKETGDGTNTGWVAK